VPTKSKAPAVAAKNDDSTDGSESESDSEDEVFLGLVCLIWFHC
jgi:hypothetical protein